MKNSQQNLNNNSDHQFGDGNDMTHAQKIELLRNIGIEFSKSLPAQFWLSCSKCGHCHRAIVTTQEMIDEIIKIIEGSNK